MNGTEEIASRLFVSRRNRPVMLQLSEKVLNQMPRFVEMLVVVYRFVATRLTRNHRLDSRRFEHLSDTLVSILRFVGQQCLSLNLRQQHIRTVQIMRLTRGEKESRGIAQRITSGMNLRAQSANGASDGFIAPLLPQQRADGRALSWHQSSGIRYRCPRTALKISSARVLSSTSD